LNGLMKVVLPGPSVAVLGFQGPRALFFQL
jgi:hypothetical protein